MKYIIKLYPTEHELTLYIDRNLSIIDMLIKEEYDDVVWESMGETTQAFTSKFISHGQRFHIMCLTKNIDRKIVAHESVHITWYLQQSCGFNYEDDPELQAYLVEYIYSNVMGYLKPSKL